MSQAPSTYKTHWHSFWFGFMSSLSIVLFVMLILTITDRITFKKFNPKNIPVTTSDDMISHTDTGVASLTSLISSIGIDPANIQTCVENGTTTDAVNSDEQTGSDAGVSGTPHSFVLINDKTYEIPGAYDADGLRMLFNEIIAGNNPQDPNIITSTADVASTTEDDWARGNADAPITVITYSDLDCPYCSMFHEAALEVMPEYTDHVRWIFRHMPSDGLHPEAREKAEAAECVGQLSGAEKFWEYIDRIFAEESI